MELVRGQQTLDKYGFDTPKKRSHSQMSGTESTIEPASEDVDTFTQPTLDDYFRGASAQRSLDPGIVETTVPVEEEIPFSMPVPVSYAFQSSSQGTSFLPSPQKAVLGDSRVVPNTPPRPVVSSQMHAASTMMTPPRPTNPVAQNVTPQSVKDAESLLRSGVVIFTPTKVQVLEDGITGLNGVKDTPISEKRRRKACGLMDGIHDILSPSSTGMSPDRRVVSVEYHREVSKSGTLKAHGLSPVITRLTHVARTCTHKIRNPFVEIPPRIVDITHIQGEYNKKGKAVGYHFAPLGSPLYASLIDIVPNTATGVFYAKVPNGYGGWKGSSFFPGSIQI